MVVCFQQRMQTAPKGTYNGMVHCAGGILKNEGPLAFYKVSYNVFSNYMLVLICLQGTLTPLLGIGVCVSIQFGALEYAKRIFANQNLAAGRGGEGGKSLTASQLFTSGVFAGLANGVVSGPVEHIRIRKSSIQYRRAMSPNHEYPLNRPTDTVEYESPLQRTLGCH